jgi:hypothetical protein
VYVLRYGCVRRVPPPIPNNPQKARFCSFNRQIRNKHQTHTFLQNIQQTTPPKPLLSIHQQIRQIVERLAEKGIAVAGYALCFWWLRAIQYIIHIYICMCVCVSFWWLRAIQYACIYMCVCVSGGCGPYNIHVYVCVCVCLCACMPERPHWTLVVVASSLPGRSHRVLKAQSSTVSLPLSPSLPLSSSLPPSLSLPLSPPLPLSLCPQKQITNNHHTTNKPNNSKSQHQATRRRGEAGTRRGALQVHGGRLAGAGHH